jgi:hypothetical protein
MGGIHTYIVLCMLHNPELCIDYEIVPDNFSPVGSIGFCMKGGAIFSMDHPTMEVGGIEYTTKGVICKGDPPRNEDIAAWVEAEKARVKRMEPQTK